MLANNERQEYLFDCSVIVPVFNHWQSIPLLLDRLKKQTIKNSRFEIILVDNGSEHIPEIDDLPINARVISCDTPGSYAARNEGIRHAKGRILAFTDADCKPKSYWLEKGLEQYQEPYNAWVLVAGGVVVEPVDYENMTSAEMYDVTLGLPQARYVRHGYAVTANLFVPAKIFAEYGKFDQARFSGGDAEFCRRIVGHNIPLIYCESAQIVHPARRNWHELEAKVRRTKGGQVTAGSLLRKIVYTIRTLLPPLRAWYYALSSTKLPLSKRLHVCWIQGRLWFVELAELYRLLRGKTPNRS